MRIWIGGGIGHGKSTLGRILARRLQLPLLDLDRIIFRDYYGGEGRFSEQETIENLNNFLKNNNSWIIEGPQKREWCESGIKEARIILILKINRWRALQRFFKRQLKLMTRWQHQKNDWIRKIRWILFYERDDFPRYMNLIKKYEKFYLVLGNNKDIRESIVYLERRDRESFINHKS